MTTIPPTTVPPTLAPAEPSPPAPPVTPLPTDTDRLCEEAAPAGFTDRAAIPPTHRDEVDCAALLGIVGGLPDAAFRPGLRVRRDQLASILAAGLAAVGVALPDPAGQPFTDVAPGSAHDRGIHQLAAAGIVHGAPAGTPATSYGPHLAVRRDQIASLLLRAAAYASGRQPASQTPAFADVGPANVHYATVNAPPSWAWSTASPTAPTGPPPPCAATRPPRCSSACSPTSPANERTHPCRLS